MSRTGPVRIAWISRHPILPVQLAELRRLFGEDVDVCVDIESFHDAEEIVRRMRAIDADECVVLAPLSVLMRLCELGVRPVWAKMEEP